MTTDNLFFFLMGMTVALGSLMAVLLLCLWWRESVARTKRGISTLSHVDENWKRPEVMTLDDEGLLCTNCGHPSWNHGDNGAVYWCQLCPRRQRNMRLRNGKVLT